MDCKNLARKADAARAAMIDLAAAGAKVPKLRLNLLRSIELLEELAIRARGGEAKLAGFTDGEKLSRALPGGLGVPVGVLPELNAPITPAELIIHEIRIRKELAARIGSAGGGKRTEAQVAVFKKAAAKRAANVAERKLARAAEQVTPAAAAK